MRYALREIDYSRISTKDQTSIVEVIVPYRGQLDALKAIEKYAARYRVIFDFDIEAISNMKLADVAKEINELNAICDNIAFRLCIPSTTIARSCKNVFFSSDFAAKTAQEAMSLVNLGIKEVYVTGSLAADIETLCQLKKHARLRLIPNVVQTDAYEFGNPAEVSPLQCFWLRPEGVRFYESCIAVMEFTRSPREKESTLLTIYNSGKWAGKLGDIIEDPLDILSSITNFYPKNIDVMRMRCGLKCQFMSRCNVCQQIPTYEAVLSRAERKSRSENHIK